MCAFFAPGLSWESKNSIWKYKNATTKDQAQIGDGKLKIKVRSGVTFTLADDGSQGPVNVQVQFGDDGARYCMRCTAPSRNDTKTYSAKDCVATSCAAETSLCGPPPPSGCGDLNLDPGEECELDADCASGDVCTDRCFCVDAQCPEAIELTQYAGDNGVVWSDTELDIGGSGLFHDADVGDSVRLVLGVSEATESAPGSCGVVTVGGVNPRAGNCRCASDTQAICDEPFANDVDDCAGGICVCYLAPPEPQNAGNTPYCLVRKLSADVTGTWNVDTGAAELTVPERIQWFSGNAWDTPCPTCEGDSLGNDGIRGGNCVGGENAGSACDANATDATFPANDTGPSGGSYSYDCWPSALQLIGGAGSPSQHVLTTGSVSLTSSLPCAYGADTCPCGQCSGDPQVPCSSNADCSAAGAGACTVAVSHLSNQCTGAGGCIDQGGGEGLCDGGPDDTFCDEVVRVNGAGLYVCTSNTDCSPGVIGLDAGTCTLSERRRCFLDTISATGDADESAPILVATYCMPASPNGWINATIELPGATRVRRANASEFPCAGSPGSDYPACP